MEKSKMTRRAFLSTSALIGAAGALGGVGGLMTSCSGAKKEENLFTPLVSDVPVYIPDLMDKAVEGRPLKAGLIGCGGRGSGVVFDFLGAGDGLSVEAITDLFPDKTTALRSRLEKEMNLVIPEDKVYNGFDGYKEMIDNNPDLDIILIATPTLFHPVHMKYAVDKGKHVFCEKPAAVDPVGIRTVMMACKQARTNGTSIVTGTQRHHQRPYVESYKRVRDGYIGEIVSGYVHWNQGGPWFANRKPEWSDMEYMYRDFFSWNWLCGDHILDQGVHNLDVFTWFSHLKPVSAVGMGSRLQRTTGDIYDNFSVNLLYEGGVRCLLTTRQIDNCANNISETIYGTKGSWSSNDFAIRDLDGNVVWQFNNEAAQGEAKQHNPYVLEHVNLVNSIRNQQPICLADVTAISTLGCIMGRESAYTGKEVTWDDMMASQLDLTPNPLHLGNTDMSKYVAPLPGKTNSPSY